MTLAPEALLVLLLEPLEPPIDLVEVPEHLVLQLGDHLGEPVWLCNPTTL